MLLVHAGGLDSSGIDKTGYFSQDLYKEVSFLANLDLDDDEFYDLELPAPVKLQGGVNNLPAGGNELRNMNWLTKFVRY